MKTNLTPAIYDREDVKRAMARADLRHLHIEHDETDEPELCVWLTDDGARLFTLEGDDRLAEPATCIYSPLDGGRLIE